MKRVTKLILLTAAIAVLLAACQVTPPTDPELQRDWEESMEELEDDFEAYGDAWDKAWDESEETGKNHHWKILDQDGAELYTIMDEEQVKQIDALLNGGEEDKNRLTDDPADPAYTYVFSQEETLKAGQDPEDREYKDLISFTVSASKDVVTLKILEDIPSLLGVDLEEYLTFATGVPSETAEALRDPARFAE